MSQPMTLTDTHSADEVNKARPQRPRIESSWYSNLVEDAGVKPGPSPSSVSRKRKRDELETITEPWTKMIQVVVGRYEAHFCVHEKIVRRIPFFRACLDAAMRESQERIVRLPEDKAGTFAELLHYIYHKELESPLDVADNRIAAGDRTLHRSRLGRKAIPLYYLAKKLMLEDLQNAVLDDIVRYMRGRCFAAWEIVLIEEVAESDDKLRHFALLNVARYTHTWGSWDNFERTNRIKYKDPEYQKTACFMVEALVRYSSENLPTTTTDPCQWHSHHRTEKCT